MLSTQEPLFGKEEMMIIGLSCPIIPEGNLNNEKGPPDLSSGPSSIFRVSTKSAGLISPDLRS